MDPFLSSLAIFVSVQAAGYGAAGSFVRECAWLYKELQSEQKKKILIIFLLPVWIIAGALVGGILGHEENVNEFYIFLAGAGWRPIITNSRAIVRIIAKTTLEMSDESGKQGNP